MTADLLGSVAQDGEVYFLLLFIAENGSRFIEANDLCELVGDFDLVQAFSLGAALDVELATEGNRD